MSDISYVVAGAKVYCTQGTHFQRLDLPKCHGAYIRDKAAMHEEDSVPFVNVQPFGVCLSGSNSNGIKETVQTEHLLPFENVAMPIIGKECTPATGTWIDAKDDVLVDGIPALTIKCTLVCTTGGGIIGFVDDGQGV